MDLPPSLTVSLFGFDRYVNNYVASYKELLTNVIAKIVNENLQDSVSITENVGAQQILVDHALHVLENQGYLKLSKTLSDGISLSTMSLQN